MTITEQPTGTALESASPEETGIDAAALERLYARIEEQIAAGRYPGAAIALARHGKLIAARAFGQARLADAGSAAVPADNDTLWLLYSQTKPVVSCAIWRLVERGLLRFHDTVADYLPDFARNGKGQVTLHQLLSHQGGFPTATVPPAAWEDHDLLRETVCNFTLDWAPGAKVVYHGASAHWVQAVLIEAVSGRDYRHYVRDEITGPLGLQGLWVGLPDEYHQRAATMHQPDQDGALVALADQNTPEFRRAGIPGGGGYATATTLTAFYQMLLAGGTLNGTRVISPRMVAYATRNHTGERVDEAIGMPMHRGMGVHVRGTTARIRGLGSIATPTTFGHGGAGSSYSWADPESGVSFTYLTNARVSEPWHSQRLDEIAVMAHAAIIAP